MRTHERPTSETFSTTSSPRARSRPPLESAACSHRCRTSPTTTRSSATILDALGARADLRAAPRAERRRPAVQLHRRPGHGEQDARRAHGLGPDAEGRLPALQGAARLPPALPERLRLPGALDRGRRRARARAQLEARDRGVRPRRVRPPLPRGGRAVVARADEGLDPARPVDGLGQRLLHVLRHEHRVHLALPADRARARAGSTWATARRSGARAAARRSPRTSSQRQLRRPRATRRSPSASRCSTGRASAIVIWTTTPWTLPANVAAAVNPTPSTGCARTATGWRSRATPTSASTRVVRGAELVGLRYGGPFDDARARRARSSTA